MESILNLLGGAGLLIIVVLAVVVLAIAAFMFSRRYKIADANEALVITGGKSEPKILVGGGAFIRPFRKGETFPLGLMTVTSTNDATQTSTMIPVVVEWTAQIRADTSLDADGNLNESLRNAILGFTNNVPAIEKSLQQTLEGDVRSIISTMSPEELVLSKAKFIAQVNESVVDSMSGLGFKLISLNIGKISDLHNYYNDLAAEDRESKRSKAANLTADANQGIAVRAAESDNISKKAEQARDLAVAEQKRELSLRNAAIKAETEVADADAEVSGQLQRELRKQEVTEREGQTEVIREQQRQAAALARRDVEITDAETARQQLQIQSHAAAEKAEIDAEAAAKVAERQAKAAADAKVLTAQGEADAISRTTQAKAEQVRETGKAEAEANQARGEAEAAATLARGRAEAESQKLMAEALAANNGANLRVTLAEIETKARITIATETATVMAEIGKNAKFVDMGGNGANGGGGDLLSNVLGNIPTLLNRLNAQSDALSDASFGGAVGAALSAIKNGGASSPANDDATSVTTPTTEPESPSVQATQPVTKAAPTVAEVEKAEKLLDTVDIKEVLVNAQANGLSFSDLAANYDISEEALQAALVKKVTPLELLQYSALLAPSENRKSS